MKYAALSKSLAVSTQITPVPLGNQVLGRQPWLKVSTTNGHGEVPEEIAEKRLMMLDMGSSCRNKIPVVSSKSAWKSWMKYIVNKMWFLFIDELHTLIGARWGQKVPIDASNILKPALALWWNPNFIGRRRLMNIKIYRKKTRSLRTSFCLCSCEWT